MVFLIGSNGQIGTELALTLRQKFGHEQVVTSDIRAPKEMAEGEIFEIIDVLNKQQLKGLFLKYRPTQIYLLAAMLSAIGEQHPQKAWDLNMNGLLNVLNLCLELGIRKIFWPSSIAVFGPNSPKVDTPQYCVMDPNSIYGISKLAGERLCEYYHMRYGLDIRSIRYPGIISWKTAPGGGTTDYAAHIFFEALANGKYDCFLSADTALPMMYMDDAVKATIQLMDASTEKLSIRSSYNLAGISFTPAMIAQEIQKILPNFEISYSAGDPRQTIADSWPESIDDRYAQKDWDWSLTHDLPSICKTMIDNLKKQKILENG